MAGPVARLRDVVEREGAPVAARRAASRLRRRLYVDEAHRWYELQLAEPPPGDGLTDGLRLVKAGEAEAALAVDLQGPVEGTVALLRHGADLWLVCEGERCAFSCWTFHRSTPVLAAPDGWLALPEGVVCLEDSATDPAYRGRGIAPAAWREIARTLRAEGTRAIVTKIAVDNVPSQRAVAKVGFREIGTMRLRGCPTRSRPRVEDVEPPSPTMAALAAGLR